MCEKLNDNPFAGLFSSINDAASFSSQSDLVSSSTNIESSVNMPQDRQATDSNVNESRATFSSVPTEDEQLDRILEDIFGIMLGVKKNERRKKPLVCVNADSMELAVFERVVMPDPRSNVLMQDFTESDLDEHTVEKQAIPYLFESYCRLQNYSVNVEPSVIKKVWDVILQNTATALQAPDLFEDQQIHDQFLRLFDNGSVVALDVPSFVKGVLEQLQTGDKKNSFDVIAASFGPILDIIKKEVAASSLVLRHHWFAALNTFVSIQPLAKLVICHSMPKSNSGRAYTDTLLGALLNMSCLPKSIEEPFDYIPNPTQQSNIESSIVITLDALGTALHKIFRQLLKKSLEVRHLTLRWIGDCLYKNANRGKLLNEHSDLGFGAMLCVPDGFMLNLANVLVRLAQPFCIKSNESEVPKIDPTYCAAEVGDEKESETRGIHLRGMSSETCLLPMSEDGHPRPVSKSYGFTTECFFMAHRALDLGYRIVRDKLLRTSQDLVRIQRLYEVAESRGNTEGLDRIAKQVGMEMSKYLSLRASLTLPEMLKLLAQFHATTAHWLVQVCLDDSAARGEKEGSYIPNQYQSITFPLPETVPDTLRCIPEFVVENTIAYLWILRRSVRNVFEEDEGLTYMTPILTEIIVLMESQKRLYNPHLRARLANALDDLLPVVDGHVNSTEQELGIFCRTQLFEAHPHRQHIVPSLLQVFVSIEMTGQSVQFEQKFNYRRPMYFVMQYLWGIAEHRQIFVSLAKEAQANMEAAQPPLFLRFINLLMNDAVFLLDEALSNMAQLRQMLQARENGEWHNLPEHERVQQAAHLEHVGRIARSDNIMGSETIATLKMLTTEIKSIFCHPTMVGRIASMLNYLLLQLVGPNKKKLKVGDQKEYAFNPANLVLNICQIYINLSKSESFTLAVSQDGRSYSPDLFKLADNVLVRIGGVGILGDLDQFAKSVEAAANQKREEEEILVNAPEEFLDPVMSTLMIDPVILPSSKITIDRQTIARHLLSDQTDPFNRSPLTMEMVKPNHELQRRIEEWIRQRKQERATAVQQ